MADKPELLHLPQAGSSLLIRSEAHSSLIARGRKDAASLVAHQAEQLYCALARVRTGGILAGSKRRWGLIDTTGKFVVEPVYHGIERFSGGLAAFSVYPVERANDPKHISHILYTSDVGHWGYLDRDGGVVISPRFERARVFSEELAGVALNGKWGFIHRDGTFAFDPCFEGVGDFTDGVAIAILNGMCGFVDRDGKVVIEHRFECLQKFSEGLAPAMIGGKYGYIDCSGSFAIKPQFEYAYDFHFGVAIVNTDRVINKVGDVIFQCKKGEGISEFVDGIAYVSDGFSDDLAYYIDTFGRRILKNDEDDEINDLSEFDAAGNFSEGLGVVVGSFAPWHHGEMLQLRRFADKKGTRLYGYIDTHGNMRIDPQFYFAGPFRNGLAVVRPTGDKKYGFIDTSGQVVIAARFAVAKDFENGMARVKEDRVEGKWGFIDKTGKIVIPYQFDQASAEDFQLVAHQ